MVPEISFDLPVDVIQALSSSTIDLLVIDGQSRTQALAWLRCAMAHFESLERHIDYLKALYRSPFVYPRPRRDGGQPGDAAALAAATKFPFTNRLPDDRVAAVA